MKLLFFSSAFCAPCGVTRAVLAEAEKLVPGLSVLELDVVHFAAEAESYAIRSTPTVVIERADDLEVFRAEGIPTLNHVLVAIAKAI